MDKEIKTKLNDVYESIKNNSITNFVRELTNKRKDLSLDLETINKLRHYVSLRDINNKGELI